MKLVNLLNLKNRLKQYIFNKKQFEEDFTIHKIKKHLIFFGCDLSNLTDDEIKQILLGFGKIVVGFGITTDEAMENTKGLFEALK